MFHFISEFVNADMQEFLDIKIDVALKALCCTPLAMPSRHLSMILIFNGNFIHLLMIYDFTTR